jgi:rsbT co-antagonist protein RsbR
MLHHLGEISAGKCSITQEEILAFHERGHEVEGDILAGLLYLHEDLRHREEALARANQELEQALQSLRAQNQELSESRAALAELATALETPIIRAGPDVLLAPLVGSIDEARAAVMLDRILAKVQNAQARVVILDMTGVSRIDAQIAARFDRMIDAVRLLGARTILAGMRPEVAAALVALGGESPLRGAIAVRDVEQAIRLYSLGRRLA